MQTEINKIATELTPTAPSRYKRLDEQCTWENGHEKGVIIGIEYQKRETKKTIDNIVIVMERLLREARQNSFNTNGNLNDTPTEEIAQNLINQLKKY